MQHWLSAKWSDDEESGSSPTVIGQSLGARKLLVLVALFPLMLPGCISSGDSYRGYRTLDNGKSVSIWQEGNSDRAYYKDERGKHYLP